MVEISVAALVDLALRAQNVPIVGVKIGAVADRSTWVVQYADTATVGDKATGASILQSVDVSAAALKQNDADTALDNNKALKAFALWVAQKLAVAPATMRAEVIAIYKTL